MSDAMTDNDLIALLREKAAKGEGFYARYAPARLEALVERMQNLIDAYEDIMDYGIVFAKKDQQDRLKAAKEKLK